MFHVAISLLFLASIGSTGFLALARARLGLTRLELVAFGFPVGMVVWSLLTLGIACLRGEMTLALTLGIWAAALVATAVLYVGIADGGPWPGGTGLWSRVRPAPRSPTLGIVAGPRPRMAGMPAAFAAPLADESLTLWQGLRRLVAWRWFWPVVVCGTFIVRWVFLWGGMFDLRPDGLYTGQINVWGDWPQHVGDAASFVYGDNFPPQHPRMAGVPYAYHYLSSLTGAMLIHFGMTPYDALALHSFVLSALIAVALLAFAIRLLRDARAAALAVLLFLLGGGFGWVLIAQVANDTGDIVGTIWNQPWDIGPQKDNTFWWENFYLSNIEPQRSTLYGLPLSLLILTLLLIGVQRWQPRVFLSAGVVVGLMPFSHLGALPALAVVTATTALLFPTGDLLGPVRQWYPARLWLGFGLVAAALAVPQLILQQVGQPVVTGGVDWNWGWLKSDSEPIWWFWLKNLGWFAPLLLIGLGMPRLFGSVRYRFLLAFMPIFVVCNVLKLQIDPLDNIKTLLYWHLAVCVLASAVVAYAWRMDRTAAARVIMLIAVVSMFFSGLLVNLQQARGLNVNRWETAADLDIAQQVIDQTDPHAVFATSPRLDHPVSTLTGRPVIMSYWGWLYTRGFDVAPREQALRDIYALAPDVQEVFDEYGVDYVAIGPTERYDYEPDLDEWRARYPVAIENDDYLIFAVSPEAQARLGVTGTPALVPSGSPASSPSFRARIVYPSGYATPVPAPLAGTPGAGTPRAGTPSAGTPGVTSIVTPIAGDDVAPEPTATRRPRT